MKFMSDIKIPIVSESVWVNKHRNHIIFFSETSDIGSLDKDCTIYFLRCQKCNETFIRQVEFK